MRNVQKEKVVSRTAAIGRVMDQNGTWKVKSRNGTYGSIL